MVHKYRAKRSDNGEWVIGFAYLLKGVTYILLEGAEDLHKFYRVDPSTLCISTGQKDCNGKEVFVGDILRDSEGKHSWVAAPFIPYVRYRGVGSMTSLNPERIQFSQWSVNGNILENSDYL